MSSAQRVVTRAAEEWPPRDTSPVPLPIVLRVPRLGVEYTLAPAPPRVVYRHLSAAETAPARPRRHWLRRLLGTLALAALALAPSVVIHWEDWGISLWVDAVRAAAAQKWVGVGAEIEDEAPPAPSHSEHPARLEPFIIPIESGRGTL